MWDESVARRGSCEISSCLWKLFASIPPEVERVTVISDSCGGQNKNIQMATMMMYAVELYSMKQIDHIFLESGHTQMEVDSMHACIEKASRCVDVIVPKDWGIVAALAKKTGQPYNVSRITSQDVIDWKKVSLSFFTNRKITETGVLLNWTKVKWLQFNKGSPVMKAKYECDTSDFMQLRVHKGTRGRSRKHEGLQETMKPLYTSSVPISTAKYRDLQDLCRTGVISTEYHEFYKSLKLSGAVQDRLDEPDAQEESDNENLAFSSW